MPDLDIVTMGTCLSNQAWEWRVPGKDYTVRFTRVNPEARGVLYDYTCDCPHYRYRLASVEGAYCKHINEAKAHRCGWDQLTDWGSARWDEGLEHFICPRCGNEAEFYQAGV